MVRISKSLITWHKVLAISHDITEIGRCTPKEGQVFESARTAAIHHTHKIADAGRIGRASRKLVVNLVDVDHYASQAIQLGMVVGQLLCLFQKDGRGQDQVVGQGNAMKILVGNSLPADDIHRSRRLEHHIAFLSLFIGGEDHITATQHTCLHDGAHRISHFPKPIVGIGVLHPNGSLVVSKLTWHQTERKDAAHTFQMTPSIDLHIVKIQRGFGVGHETHLKKSRVAIQYNLFLKNRRIGVFMRFVIVNGLVIHNMIVVDPNVV